MQILSQIEQTLCQTFYKDRQFEFWWINGVIKIKGGTLIKYLISSLFNLAETLHSLANNKNKQVAKI